MCSLVTLIIQILQFYLYIIIASVISSWLIAFQVINIRNQFVAQIVQILHRLTDPVFSKVRQFMPNLGNIDISPIVVIFGVMFLMNVIGEYGYKLCGAY